MIDLNVQGTKKIGGVVEVWQRPDVGWQKMNADASFLKDEEQGAHECLTSRYAKLIELQIVQHMSSLLLVLESEVRLYYT